ncbi:hypothetical protein TRFO_31469 [Tritrichomonas foetus]|uniref:Thioredoxin domain-containing protein n=1 Tax=Tritrichomonas foetus TaxID=1144522 RepID=A0A1J4JWH8_9EUKA|nr:hypothetical protein TRFO_31469 [Tritrichomonas foetus]|eukprot:OHT01645.1 hypothetical protein TRFO_31469 [Tritrichomonas foetus]
MILLLFSILQIFIPYHDPVPLLPVLTDYEVTELSKHTPVIALALADDDQFNIEIIQDIEEIATYFVDIRFSILDPESADYVSKEQDGPLPSLFLYHEQCILASYLYPDSNSFILSLCKIIQTNLRNENPTEISTLPQLYLSVSSCPFTILTTQSNYPQALNLHQRIGSQLGIIDLLNISNSLMHQLFPKNDNNQKNENENENILNENDEELVFGLFRKEDKIITNIRFSVKELIQKSIPVYRFLMATDILDPSNLVFSLFSHKIGEEEREFLYKLSKSFPNFIIGFGGLIVDYISNFAEGISGDDNHQILVFNLPNGVFYDSFKYFGNTQFNLDEWTNQAIKMLNDINENILLRSYISEPENDDEAQSEVKNILKSGENAHVDVNDEFYHYCVKVVGKNYENFVNDPNHEIVMLYKKEDCPFCRIFFPEFLEFTKECFDKNMTHLKFGYIDITKNSSPKPFPYMPGVPHVHFFPKLNKSDDYPIYVERNRNGLIRLLKENSVFDIPFEAPEIDKTQYSVELMKLLMNSNEIPEEAQAKLFQYIVKVADIFDDPNLFGDDEENKGEISHNDDGIQENNEL